MKKAALVVLTVCLLFPLLATRAAPPGEAEPAVDAKQISGSVVYLVEAQDLAPPVPPPESFELLTPEAQRLYKLRYSPPGSPSSSPGETPRQRFTTCMAANGGDASLCDLAADIAHMKPCLAANADDCPAMEAWTHAMGQVGVYPAPQTTGASIRSVQPGGRMGCSPQTPPRSTSRPSRA